ncbi:hypothetical protein CW740_09275 [Kangiella profundi]|uniref:Outer membrane protein beta-barrel domain-containing protein n=2 Tax=Kangiella profundi TaxID=1561924 RepID=A0A2K9A9L8_9GAMM|nr:hypothetical protein CW740_09275 [Kangiella profundi]GGE98633.1 hypothetical protein GCM10011356_10570 [Kangiella profundi]
MMAGEFFEYGMITMKKALFLALMSTIGLSAQANDKLSYDYWQFGYIHSEGELTSDKTGFKIDLVGSFNESTYLRYIAQEQTADIWTDNVAGEVTAKEYSVALGWHTPMGRSTDFFAEVGYLKQDAEGIIPGDTYGNDEDGYLANIGIRSRFAANWEYTVFAGYRDIDFSPYVDEVNHEDDNDSVYGLETRYYFSKLWSVGIAVSEEATGLTSGLNLRFTP